MTEGRRWWAEWLQRRIVDPVAVQLRQGLSRRRIAWSLTVGALCAFFPVLGLATPACLVAGCALRLNHPILQAVNLATAPLYVPMVYAFMRLGDLLLGPARALPAMAGHAVLGWFVAAPVWIGIGFPVLHALLGCKGLTEWFSGLPVAWAAASRPPPACSKNESFAASTPMRSFASRS